MKWQDIDRRVLEALRSSKGLTRAQLSQRLHFYDPTLDDSLVRMREQGKVHCANGVWYVRAQQ